MDVFISWSGERSFKVASALNEWLPVVIQSVTPWFSPEDIEKGARWMAELNKQLDKLKMGIICVTPENMEAPWLLFEAGALSKVLGTSLVCPFLFGLEPTDIQGPLAQFQATRATKEDVRKLLSTINKNAESQLIETQIEHLFSVLWPDLDEKLRSIKSDVSVPASRSRPVPELLSEVLERVRSIERQLTERTAITSPSLSPSSYARLIKHREERQRRLAASMARLKDIENILAMATTRYAELEKMSIGTPESNESEIKVRSEEIKRIKEEMSMLSMRLDDERKALVQSDTELIESIKSEQKSSL